MSNDSKTVRGLSIAVLVISILSLLVIVLYFAVIAVGASYGNDPQLIAEVQNQLDSQYSSSGSSYFDADQHFDLAASGIDAASLINIGIAICFGLGIWGLICSVVTLIAGILGTKNCGQPHKLGGAFGWAIAGAVAALLTMRLVTVVLLIVSAVFIHKVRNAPIPTVGQAPYNQQYRQ